MTFQTPHIHTEIHHVPHPNLLFPLTCLFLLMSPLFSYSPRLEMWKSSLIPTFLSSPTFCQLPTPIDSISAFAVRQPLQHPSSLHSHYFCLDFENSLLNSLLAFLIPVPLRFPSLPPPVCCCGIHLFRKQSPTRTPGYKGQQLPVVLVFNYHLLA